jgi:hypothetical protein
MMKARRLAVELIYDMANTSLHTTAKQASADIECFCLVHLKCCIIGARMCSYRKLAVVLKQDGK